MSNDTVAQLERIEAELQNLAERCLKGVLQRTEVQSQLDQLIQKIEACLDPRSDAFRLFDRARRERLFWWSFNISGYAEKADCEHITHWLERLPAILNEFEPSVLRAAARPKDQFFISAGDTYRGMKATFDIMRRASTSLGVVDQFLDQAVFPYLESLDPKISLRLLTAAKKPIFPALLRAFESTRPNVEARECGDCHDRFLVIDDIEVWHLGGSINGIGKQAFLISRVEDPTELGRFLMDYADWWTRGTKV